MLEKDTDEGYMMELLSCNKTVLTKIEKHVLAFVT